MNREEVEFNNKKYTKEVTLYFNNNDKFNFINDVQECLERDEIDAKVLFISLIETARDVCREADLDFNDCISRCIILGSVDDYLGVDEL